MLESGVQNFFHAVELGPPEVLHFFASTVYSVDAAINLIEPLVDLIKPCVDIMPKVVQTGRC